MTPKTRNILIGLFILGGVLAIGTFVYLDDLDDSGHVNVSIDITLPDGRYTGDVYVSSKYTVAFIYRMGTISTWGSSSQPNNEKFYFTGDNQQRLILEWGQNVQSDHVYFISPPKILREVSFEELGIEPMPGEVWKVIDGVKYLADGIEQKILNEYKQKITEYMEKNSAKIFGEVME